jgi:ferredoxin
MLMLYFSGTGNSRYIAELFCRHMNAECCSIEENADFEKLIKANEIIGFCYPVYGSRVPLIMREFISNYMAPLKNKKLIIFVTQLTFSGDGARVLCDLFPENHIDVIYAEHFFMPNNVCNFALLRKTSDRNIQKRLKMAEAKMSRVCINIKNGVVRKRGFSAISRMLGKIQGKPWQGDGKNAFAAENTMEYKAKHGVRIDAGCIVCNACIESCPMQNLENRQGRILHKNNCTICYRCVNLCPQRAITVFFHKKPLWQYKGV